MWSWLEVRWMASLDPFLSLRWLDVQRKANWGKSIKSRSTDIISPRGMSWYSIPNYAIEPGLISLEVGRRPWGCAGAISLHLKAYGQIASPPFLLSPSLKDTISSKYAGSEPWHLFLTTYSLTWFSSPTANEVLGLTHSSSDVLLPMSLFLPSFKPSLLSIRIRGHWQVFFYLTSLLFKPSF